MTLISASDLTSARRYLISLVERWQGPISLALFARTAPEVENVIEFMTTLQKCHPLARQFVTFHLVFPTHNTKIPDPAGSSKILQNPPAPPLDVVQNLMPILCQNFYKNLPSVRGQEQEIDAAPEIDRSVSHHQRLRKFPINLLRNVGRRTTRTKYSFVIDLDLLPSAGLRTQFQEFISARARAGAGRARRRRRRRVKVKGANTHTDTEQPLDHFDFDEPGRDRDVDSKVVFVVPAFETKNGETPSTKAELLPLLDSYQARPYYFDLCWKCQVIKGAYLRDK